MNDGLKCMSKKEYQGPDSKPGSCFSTNTIWEMKVTVGILFITTEKAKTLLLHTELASSYVSVGVVW